MNIAYKITIFLFALLAIGVSSAESETPQKRNVRSRKLQQQIKNFRANLTPTSASTKASWCSASPARGELNTNSHRFCVYVNNLRFLPTDARLRGDDFNNRKINCFRSSNGVHRCESCYNFSGHEVSQLNRGELRVMVENTNNNLCRISGNLRQR